MPGGTRVIHELWRMAVSYLWQAFGEEWRHRIPDVLLASVPEQHIKIVEQLLRGKRLAMTSSCGRLFDAGNGLTLGRTVVTYEAQAAIALEACCHPESEFGYYPFAVREGECLEIETAPLFGALMGDLSAGVSPTIISRRFHEGLVEALTEVVIRVAHRSNLHEVCLSGGSFQNAHLLNGLTKKLTAVGLRVHTNRQIPSGDGGLSFRSARHRCSSMER